MGGNDRQVWDRMEVLFGEALSMAPERRTAFLDEVCADDPALRTELESLLSSYDEASKYFDSLAADVLPSLLQDLNPAAASLSFPSRIGQEIGAYRIVERLGGGGMGVVYKAYDTRLDRSVALKFLPPHLSSNSAAEQRFIREAKAASALDHLNICTIYEIGETDEGQLFIAMAYYAGETLKDRIGRGPLPIEDAVDYATQIADGLSCAHRAGIIHRDIKPANVLITDTGVAKIVDFGLARGPESNLTKTGATMGTVAYMSPEQARGETVNGRTDLWALGVVLYEMLTRERPFKAGNEHATLYAIQHEKPIPLSTLRSDVPYALQETVARCLEKAPIARPETAAVLAARLRSVGEGTGATADSSALPTWRWPTRYAARIPRTALALIGLVVVGLTLWSITLQPSSPDASEQAPRPPLGDEQGLVVLPCTDMGEGTPSQAFCTGLMATLTDQIARFRDRLGVWVVPAGEVRDRGAATPSEAHRWYDARWVLTGSATYEDEQIRARLTLMDSTPLQSEATSRPEATDAFMLSTSDAITLHDDAIARVASLLGVELQPDMLDLSAPNGTSVPSAYLSYLEGRGHLWAYEDPSHLNAAVAAFQQSIAKDSSYAQAYARLAESYWRRFEATRDTQWVTQARQLAHRALDLNTQLAAAHEVLGLIHQGTGHPEEAIRAFQQALDLNPERADIHRRLALAYETQGRLDEARSMYERFVYKWPEYWVGHNDLGYLNWQQGRYEAAVNGFRHAQDVAPNYFLPLNNLAALYHYLGRTDDARMMYRHSIDAEPNYGAYSNLGTIHFEERRYKEAIQMYEQALSLEQGNYSVWGNLAAARYWTDDRGRAETHYRKAIELAESQRQNAPPSPLLLVRLGGYYAMLDQPDTARALTEEALAIGPDRGEVAFSAAATYERLGQRDRALQWIENALDLGYPLALIESDPALRNLRTDVRYRAIVQRHDSIS